MTKNQTPDKGEQEPISVEAEISTDTPAPKKAPTPPKKEETIKEVKIRTVVYNDGQGFAYVLSEPPFTEVYKIPSDLATKGVYTLPKEHEKVESIVSLVGLLRESIPDWDTIIRNILLSCIKSGILTAEDAKLKNREALRTAFPYTLSGGDI